MSTMQGESSSSVDPNLRMFGDPRARVRYPSPFFDISQQYVPPTIKELLKWVYFYVTNNSFLGPAITKIARYPVTDTVFEDDNADIVKYWSTLINNTLQIKTFNMEVNLDLTSYGNAFVTIHYPFSRMLQCQSCNHKVPWKVAQKRIDNLVVKMKCKRCGQDGKARIVDIPYKSAEGVRLLRINPEYIDIKYNEVSGRHTYLYSLPDRLKRGIMSGDPDIFEDTPLVYIEAIKQRRKIKLSSDNIFHLKNPTLAGKDMGWGLPRVATALKDLYQYYTLRRAQEAVMNEHILPFDMIFPSANGKMDPYVHTDLASWKKEIQNELARRRRDPNYKAVLPFPVGVQRIGGDGKALMLTPEMDFIAKTVIGACGIPQEFVYGGTMNWTGSSVALRTLENDFLHQRSQLLQMNIWIVERVRLYLGAAAPKTLRFTDFKMADDIQKLQIMVGMASNNKLPWEDLQRELGRDPAIVRKKLEEEAEFDARLQGLTMRRTAESQAQANLVQARFNAKAQTDPGGDTPGPAVVDKITAQSVGAFAERIAALDPDKQMVALERLRSLNRNFAQLVEKSVENIAAGHPAVPSAQDMQMQQDQQAQEEQAKMAPPPQPEPKPAEKKQKPINLNINMKPLPEQRPPRRKGAI